MAKNISSSYAKRLIKNGAKVIDIRDTNDFLSSHIPGAFNFKINELDKIKKIIFNKNEIVIIVCSHGIRSIAIAEELTDQGYTNVFNLKNGYENY